MKRLGAPIPAEARAVLDRMLGGGGAGRATVKTDPAIAADFRRQAIDAGVPAEEADANARIASAYFHTRAEARGLGEAPADLYRSLRVEGTPGARARAAAVEPTEGVEAGSSRPADDAVTAGASGAEPPRSGLAPSSPAETAAAMGRLRAANAAYTEYAKTYKNPIVGPGLATTGYAGDYRRTDAAFIRNAVKPGPLGYENARAHLQAARNDPEAVQAMQDAALNPLRRAALGPGFVPPGALKNWRDSYGPALRALDEVEPGFSSRFDEAGRATQALLDMGQEHAAAAKAAQKEAARQAVLDDTDRRTRLGQANAADRDAVTSLLAERKANDAAASRADKAGVVSALSDRAASDRAAVAQSRAEAAAGVGRARDIVRDARATPAAQFARNGGTGVASTEVENAVGGLLRTGTGGATRMRELVASVGADPDALAGLQKAGTDWLVRTHIDATGALSGLRLIQFLKNNGDSLRELYPANQVSMMGAVARDAEAGARWRTATAVKGGSDSVKNLLAAAAEGNRGPHTTLGMVAVEAVSHGYEHGGLTGAAYGGMGAAALFVMNAMRQAGIRRTSDLYMAALADPELARTLISKMPTRADGGAAVAFGRAVRRAALLGPMATGEGGPDGPKGPGGQGRGPGAPPAGGTGPSPRADPPQSRGTPSGGLGARLGAIGASLASGHAASDYASLVDPRGERGPVERFVGGLSPPAMVAHAADAVTNYARFSGDTLAGRYGDLPMTDPASIERGAPATFDAVGLLAGGGMTQAERGAAGIFGGRLAATADHAAMARAEEFLAAGAGRADVLRDTGYFRGPDGLMRREIPDAGAALKPGALRPGIEGARIGDVLDHPDLYRDYPGAADLRFRTAVRPSDGDNLASFDTGAPGHPPEIFLNPNQSPADARSALLHELQHYVQGIEGMNPGADYNGLRSALPSMNAVRDAKTMGALLAEGVRPEDAVAAFGMMRGRAPHGAALDLAQQLGSDGLARLPSGRTAEDMRYDAYYRNMGEVEARNVENRADMAPEERAARAPWRTHSVHTDRQIQGTGGLDPRYDADGEMIDVSRADNATRGRLAAAGAARRREPLPPRPRSLLDGLLGLERGA